MVFLPLFLSAQSFPKAHLEEDLRFLGAALLEAHGNNYRRDQAQSIRTFVDSLVQRLPDSLSAAAYEQSLREALFALSGVHTRITAFPLGQGQERSYFPLDAYTVAGNLYLYGSDSLGILRGEKVLRINDIAVATQLHQMLHFRAADGGTTAFSEQLFNIHSARLLSLYWEYPARYEVQTDRAFYTLEAAPQANRPLLFLRNLPADWKDVAAVKGLRIIADSIALYTLPSFAKSETEGIRALFAYLETQAVSDLILDLRGNLGGNRNAGIELVRNLVDLPFSYRIVRPKGQTLRYYSRRGKWYYLLSFLRYDVACFWRSRKGPWGREFVFRYRPYEQPYTGNLYVLVDGYTASTSTMALSLIRQQRKVTVVGRQPAGGDNGNNGGTFPRLKLPRSGAEIIFPAYRLITDPTSDHATGVEPDFPVSYTLEDVLGQEDLDLKKVLEVIQAR